MQRKVDVGHRALTSFRKTAYAADAAVHLEAVDLNAALVINVCVLALRCGKKLLVVQEVHVTHRLLHLTSTSQCQFKPNAVGGEVLASH